MVIKFSHLHVQVNEVLQPNHDTCPVMYSSFYKFEQNGIFFFLLYWDL